MRRFFLIITVYILLSCVATAASLPNRILAGFLDTSSAASSSRVDMSKVHSDGYNTVVVGYAEINGENIDFYTTNTSTQVDIVNKVKKAEELGINVLVAVGGFENTFHPGVTKGQPDQYVIGRGMSDANIKVLANNIVRFLHEYDMDGIVYDIHRFTSPELFYKLSRDIKQIDPKLVIVASPEVNDYQLVTAGLSQDYNLAIKKGVIDYLFIQEYDNYPQYDPSFISESYLKIIKNAKVPLSTRIVIGEPTIASVAGLNTIYHPHADPSKTLTTEQAVSLMLPELEKLRFKPRFAGVIGRSLNADYAANLYGDDMHNQGAFAQLLKNCIQDGRCYTFSKNIKGPVIAGLMQNTTDKNSTARDLLEISMPNEQEYCDKYPNICKYNIIVPAEISYDKHTNDFKLDYYGGNGPIKSEYTPKQFEEFVKYMRLKGKNIIVSFGDDSSDIDWSVINLDKILDILQKYDFDGINFDFSIKNIPTNDEQTKLAGQKILELYHTVKRHNHGFLLTFSTDWQNIVPHIESGTRYNVYDNYHYADLIKTIGVYDIDYIFLNTYGEPLSESIFSFDKDASGRYLSISSKNNYEKFIASLAWAITTEDGILANLSKYDDNSSALIIPANKLVFQIPAESLDSQYSFSASLIIDVILHGIEEHGASFKGFVVNDVAMDARDKWSLTNAISNITLPKQDSSQLWSKSQHSTSNKTLTSSKDYSNGVLYPDSIGSYKTGTIVKYADNTYKCYVADASLCNDIGYSPSSSLGYLAWQKVDLTSQKNKKKTAETTKADDDGFYHYPEGLGKYVAGTKIIIDNGKFACKDGQQQKCNDSKYSPLSARGYEAWIDISLNNVSVDVLSANGSNSNPNTMADYTYPNDIDSYKGGTIVQKEGKLYRCRYGFDSTLCSLGIYAPDGAYGDEAWTKIN